ncbi:MAG: hypothetical protein EHM93_15850 [Bacteroidales bacterium]|nr:MAG: hypothetical protein EHM93_15850 [Bacteroidales bacterium]
MKSILLKSRVFIIIAICILFVSCENNRVVTNYSNFPVQVDMAKFLQSNPTLDFCYMPVEILSFDSLLVILELKDVNASFRIYRKDSYNLVSSFVKRGNGPNEYLAPAYPKMDHPHNMLWFLDLPKATLFGFTIKDIINSNSEVTPKKSIKIDRQLLPFWDYHVMQDTSILLPTSVDNSIFTLIGAEGQVIKTYGRADEKSYNLSNPQINYFYSKTFSVSDSLGEIVCFYKYSDKQIKYSLNSNKIELFFGKYFKERTPILLNTGGIDITYLSFSRVKRYGKYLYSVYDGMEIKGKGKERSSTVLVFDWNVKPIAVLSFPNSIIDFTIDEKKVYLLTADLENPLQVYSFDTSVFKE